MARFQFQVRDSQGQVRSGIMEAHDFSDARSIIERRGFSVVDLKPVFDPPAPAPGSSSGSLPRPPLGPPPELDPLPQRLGPPPPLDSPPEPLQVPPLTPPAESRRLLPPPPPLDDSSTLEVEDSPPPSHPISHPEVSVVAESPAPTRQAPALQFTSFAQPLTTSTGSSGSRKSWSSSPIAAPANIQIHTPTASSRHHIGPAERLVIKPSVLERVRLHGPSTAVFRGLMAILGVVGCVWLAASWKTPAPTGAAGAAQTAAPRPNLHLFKLTLEGVVTIADSSLGDVQITVDLPDIPYQQTFDWAKISHPRAGHFVVNIEFESSRQPRQMVVRARKPGYGEAILPAQPIRPEGGFYRGLDLNVKQKTL